MFTPEISDPFFQVIFNQQYVGLRANNQTSHGCTFKITQVTAERLFACMNPIMISKSTWGTRSIITDLLQIRILALKKKIKILFFRKKIIVLNAQVVTP